MPNTLNIPEVTLAQIADSTTPVNVINPAVTDQSQRVSVYQPLVVRVTDHEADDGGTADYAEGMALFLSSRHGEPWVLNGKRDMATEHILHHSPAGAPVAAPVNATVIYPDYDYTTFE